jgi:hypothetical protein
MQESDPTTWPLITWIIAVSMALSGGLINWFGQSKNFIDKRKFNIFELFGELFTSGFVGVGLFMVLDSMGQPMGISAASAGIGGHMATRFLFLIENIIETKLSAQVKNDLGSHKIELTLMDQDELGKP